MDIECLIRELIIEDRFNEKYTKNQRSIFCKNMYEKIALFIKENEKDKKNLQDKLEVYRIAYENMEKKHRRDSWIEIFYGLNLFLLIIYNYVKLITFISTQSSHDNKDQKNTIINNDP
jgi:hypothetical protein